MLSSRLPRITLLMIAPVALLVPTGCDAEGSFHPPIDYVASMDAPLPSEKAAMVDDSGEDSESTPEPEKPAPQVAPKPAPKPVVEKPKPAPKEEPAKPLINLGGAKDDTGPAASAGGGSTAAAGGSGTVRGTITYDGTAPTMAPLTVGAAAAEGCHHGGDVDSTNRSLLVGPGGGIANVVIEIFVKGESAKASPEPIALDQVQCRYEPHVLLINEGSTVQYNNPDTVGHNVHTYPRKNKGINKTVAPGGSETQELKKAEVFEIKCDIHPWMASWTFVTDAPYAALTGADGSFELTGIPAGSHKYEIWHESCGKQKGKIEVSADGTATLDAQLKVK